MKNCDSLQDFISKKTEEIIRTNVVAFHLNNIACLGTLRIDENVQKMFNLEDNKTYDIYLKLKNPLADCYTRVVLTKITSKNYGP